MKPELIGLICKVVEQVSDNCRNCTDCKECLYNGVFCFHTMTLESFRMLPEDWNYELLRKRLRGEDDDHTSN